MDVTKKARTERMVVAGLLLVFALTGWRAASAMGWLKERSLKAAQPLLADRVDVSKPLDETVKAHWEQMETPLNVAVQAPSPVTTAALAAPLYTAQTLRDPLESLLPKEPERTTEAEQPGASDAAPPSVSAAALPALTVQGIWWGGVEPKALINGKVYGVGEELEGATITAIDRRGVTVDYHGTTVLFTTSNEGAHGGLPHAAANWR